MEALDDLRAIAAGREQARTAEVQGLLEEALQQEWDRATRQALESTLGTLRRGQGPVTEEDVQQLLGELRPFLSRQLERGVTDTVGQAVTASYLIGQEEVATELAATLNVTDRRVQNFLQDNALFWIGNHYDQQVQDRIGEAADEVFENEDGVLPRREAGEKFREAFEGEFQKSTSYWRLLANDVTTKSREFGRVEGLVKADIDRYMIDAVLDRRTTAICRALDGREFRTGDAVEQRDQLVQADDPEAVKDQSPWPRERKTEDGEAVAVHDGERLSEMSNEELANSGILLPPFHGNCRTRIQGVTGNTITAS